MKYSHTPHFLHSRHTDLTETEQDPTAPALTPSPLPAFCLWKTLVKKNVCLKNEKCGGKKKNSQGRLNNNSVAIKPFPGNSVVKNRPANAADTGEVCSIPGSGRSPRGGQGNSLQGSGLENPMDRRAEGLQSIVLHRAGDNWSNLAQY